MTRFFSSILLFLTLLLSCILADAYAQKKRYYSCYQAAKQYQLSKDSSVKDGNIQLLLRRYKDSIQASMDDIVALSDVPLSKAQPESTLGNWITDNVVKAIRNEQKKIDACIISYGSIGIDYLAPGAIKRKDIYSLIPIDNEIMLIKLSGLSLQYLCDSIAQSNGLPISGISFQIRNNKAYNVMVGNYPLKESLVYTIAVNDYLWKNKRFIPVFHNANAQHSFLSLRKILFKNLEALNRKSAHIKAQLENRISYAE
jgi:2',3'-cyclic-nucleotide 2'-phosphodiesterase (5'-nucleotidase family)